MIKANIKLTTLSPIHIGDNDTKKLSSLADFIVENDHIRLIDHKKLDKIFEENEAFMEDYIKEIRLHKGKTFSLKDFFKRKEYGVDIEEILSDEKIPIIGTFTAKEIQPFISENGKRYIPGSSIKGAVRNAFAYKFLKQNRYLVDNLLNNKNLARDKKPFFNVEKTIFGRNPNYNLFRFVHITDTKPFQKGSSAVYHLNSYNIKKETPGSPINFENIREKVETDFRFSLLNIGNSFISNFSPFWKNWNDLTLKNIFAMINDLSLNLINRELNEFRNKKTISKTVEFYNGLKKQIENSNNESAFLCLGRGTTTFGKTILLLLNENELEDLRNKMKKSKFSKHFGWKYVPGKGLQKSDIFPVTRLMYKEDNQFIGGFGWIKLEEK